jgi:predicted nucleic acid-binding protein
VIILDTDALSHLQKVDTVGISILAQLETSPDRDIRITTVSAYEMLRGASTLIDRRKKERRDPVPAFRLLRDLVEYLGTWRGLILPHEVADEKVFAGFPARLRQELKDDARIAAVALNRDAAVWTCNVAHFIKVPGLTVVRAETGSMFS